MPDHDFSELDEAIKNTNSIRGALFVLRASLIEFTGHHIGYEYFVRKKSYIRGDVITQTTLPHNVTAHYASSGGQNADPIIENIPTLKDRLSVNVQTLIETSGSKFYKNKFFAAISDIGIQSMTVYAFLPENSRGFGGLTILESEDKASFKYPPEHFAEIGYNFHRALMRHGHIMRYLGLNEKEQNVLERMADGKTAQDIAHEFNVTPRTIEMRLQSARQKLKSRTTTEAVYKAVCYGIL